MCAHGSRCQCGLACASDSRNSRWAVVNRRGRRGLRSAVLTWHRQEQARRRKAISQLGANLDNEIFAG